MLFIAKVCSVWLHFLMQLSFGPWFPGDHIQSILTAFMELSQICAAYSLAVATGSGQEQPDICLPQHMGYQGSSSVVAHLSHTSQPSSLSSGLPSSTILTASRNQHCEAHLPLHFTISGRSFSLWVCHLMPHPRTWSTHLFQHFAT